MKKIICVFLVLCYVSSFAQTVLEWRGTDRKGVYAEKNLVKSWTKDGPKQLWLNENVGNGYGSPSITADRIYINGEIDTLGYLIAMDLKGTILWKTDYGKEWVKTFPGSRSQPTIVGDLIYVCSGLGNIACIDTKGTKKWAVNMLGDLHGQELMHGHSESPLVDADNVFLTPGGKDTAVVALNRFTGKIVWVYKGNGERPGYNSPVLITLAKRSVLVTFTAYTMLGLDAKTGALLWKHEQINVPVAERQLGNGDTHSNSVWYEDGCIYYIAGDGNCAVKLELAADGTSVKQLWRNKDVDNFMGGFIKIGNYIYSCTNAHKNLVSIDAKAGVAVDSLKCGIGSLILADNLLYYYNQKGEVHLIKYNGAKLEIVSTFKVAKGTKEHFAHPVICNKVLYIRHGKAFMAYSLDPSNYK